MSRGVNRYLTKSRRIVGWRFWYVLDTHHDKRIYTGIRSRYDAEDLRIALGRLELAVLRSSRY